MCSDVSDTLWDAAYVGRGAGDATPVAGASGCEDGTRCYAAVLFPPKHNATTTATSIAGADDEWTTSSAHPGVASVFSAVYYGAGWCPGVKW